MAGEECILEAKHLAKRFGRRRVLTDITIYLQRGRMVGIVGENGSGKSTLGEVMIR